MPEASNNLNCLNAQYSTTYEKCNGQGESVEQNLQAFSKVLQGIKVKFALLIISHHIDCIVQLLLKKQ